MFLTVIYILNSMILSNQASQSFRCLVESWSPQTFFVNFKFKCTNHKIKETGCLTQLTVDYFDFMEHHISWYDFINQPSDSRLAPTLFSHTKYKLYTVVYKNRYTKAVSKTYYKANKFKKVSIGISIPVNTQKIKYLHVGRTISHNIHTNSDYIHFKHPLTHFVGVNYILPISYTIKDNIVSNISIESEGYSLVKCVEKSVNVKQKTNNVLTNLLQRCRQMFGTNKININKTAKDRDYERYEKYYQNSNISIKEKRLGAVVFIERLDFNDEKIIKLTNNEELYLDIIPNFEDNFALMFAEEKIFGVLLDDNQIENLEMLGEWNHELISYFGLKRIGKANKIRK